MSTVSAGDITKYANAEQVWAKPILNVEPLDEIADALVNDAPVYPLVSVTVDNTSADWLDGDANMLFRFEEPGGTVIAWGVLRKDSTANTFYPDVKSDGDFGYATNEGITLSDNDVIRVYRNHPNWAMISRVTSAGLQKKKWDIAYTNEGTTPPPVAIMGHDQQADIDTGTSKATFSFDASSSYGWTSGETITTFAYTLPTGATVTGGAVNTDSVTFTIVAGIYVVQLDITSSTGITRSAFRTIYANSTGSSFGETYPIEAINSDSTDINGWSGQFTVLGDVSSDIYPGAKCHWYVPVFYDGAQLTDNDAFIDVFVGYLTEINATTDSNQVKRTSLTFKSPLKLAQLLPSATQTFEEVTTPSTWTHVAVGLSDPAYAAYYILQYHTTLLDNHDFLYESTIRDLRRRVFGFPADNISAHLDIDGQIMRGNVGCRSDGTITLTQEPSLRDNTARNALDSKFTWTEESLRSKLTMGIRFRPQIAYLIMAAVAYAGDQKSPMIAYAAKAPGKAQAQGVTKSNIPDISITVSGGTAELYAVIGHMFALLNNPLDKLDIPVHAMFDIADPADADWHVLNISESTYLPVTMDNFGVRWSSAMRLRPTRVARQWSRQNGSWVKVITQQNRAESFGRPGVFHPIYKGEIQPYINPLSGWLDGLNITMPDINIDFDVAGLLPTSSNWNVGWTFNNFGVSGYSDDWNGDSPSYASTAIDLAGVDLDGNVVAQELDGSGDGSGYLITKTPYDGTIFQYNVYENPDVSADPTNWSLDHSFQWNETTTNHEHQIRIMSNASQTMIVYITSARTYYEHKPAAGVWQAAVQIGNTTAHTPPAESETLMPIHMEGTSTWTVGSGPTDSPAFIFDHFTIFSQSVVAGAWTQISNAPYSGGGTYTVKMVKRSIGSPTVMYVSRVLTLPTPSITYLYRIDDATETWLDISPVVAGSVYAPARDNAFAVNGVNAWMIGTSIDGSKRLFSSTDSGTNWDDLGSTKYSWLKVLETNEVFVLGGDNLLDVTINTFGTFHSRLGQLGKIGSIGFIKDFISSGFYNG